MPGTKCLKNIVRPLRWLHEGQVDQIPGTWKWLLETKTQVFKDCEEFQWNSETNACSYYSVSWTLPPPQDTHVLALIWLPYLWINPIGKIMISFPREARSRSTFSPGVNNATRWKNDAFAGWHQTDQTDQNCQKKNWTKLTKLKFKEMLATLYFQVAYSSQGSFDEGKGGADYILSSFLLIVSSLLLNIIF